MTGLSSRSGCRPTSWVRPNRVPFLVAMIGVARRPSGRMSTDVRARSVPRPSRICCRMSRGAFASLRSERAHRLRVRLNACSLSPIRASSPAEMSCHRERGRSVHLAPRARNAGGIRGCCLAWTVPCPGRWTRSWPCWTARAWCCDGSRSSPSARAAGPLSRDPQAEGQGRCGGTADDQCTKGQLDDRVRDAQCPRRRPSAAAPRRVW